MARKHKEPPIVAELGRPETPEETAARKAENSKLYRERKTVNNLVLSLLACLGLLIIMVAMVPRGTGDYLDRNVDVAELAEQATPTAGQPIAAPEVPDGWLAKQAEIRFSKQEQVTYWYIGYTTPKMNYASVAQGYTSDMEPAPDAWVNRQVEDKKQTGTVTIDGVTWQEYDHRGDSDDGSNVLYGLVTELPSATLIVAGTDSKASITELAKNTYASLEAESPDAAGASKNTGAGE